MRPQAVCTRYFDACGYFHRCGLCRISGTQRHRHCAVSSRRRGPDVTARLTGNKLAERLGKSIIIENRAGANGGLGATGATGRA